MRTIKGKKKRPLARPAVSYLMLFFALFQGFGYTYQVRLFWILDSHIGQPKIPQPTHTLSLCLMGTGGDPKHRRISFRVALIEHISTPFTL